MEMFNDTSIQNDRNDRNDSRVDCEILYLYSMITIQTRLI
jgi:hypothetical protein